MFTLPLLRRLLLLGAGVALLVACGSAGASPASSSPAPAPAPGTVAGVGILPSTIGSRPPIQSTTPNPTALSDSTASSTAASAGGSTTSAGSAGVGATSSTTAEAQYVGSRTAGNRVLMIGDSVLASTSRRYSNDMCNALVPLGWQVEVDAEVGRFIDFGDKVLDKRLAAGWDVGVIFLGNNYGSNIGVYAPMLSAQVDRLSPNPVVLVTVTEFKPNRADVNAAIRDIAAHHSNVTVLDWATISVAAHGLLGGDGLHLTPSGRNSLQVDEYYVGVSWKQTKLNRLQGFLGGSKR